MDYKRLVILLFIFCFCNTLIAYSCRYTIREIGFSDIGSEPHSLYIFTNSETSEKEISSIQNLSRSLLNETNVKLKLFDADKEKYNIKSFPSAVFVFPGGEHMIFSLKQAGRSLNESVWMLLDNLVTSTCRNTIKEKLLQAYCVVLIVEGDNRQQNENVLLETKKAVRGITRMLDQMPKVVDSPPAIVVLPRKDIPDERLLLASLGITEKETGMPSVAILYGRGRIMGPVLQGDLISMDIIHNLLSIVGADCECGLDHSWILGRMIPLRWEASVQTELAKNLGFDIENPLVRSEMSQILSLKPAPVKSLDPMGSSLLGYSEGELDIAKSPERISKIPASEVRKSFYQTEKSKNNLVFKTIILGFGGILLIVIVTLLFIQYKRKKILR
jgi:hypothetical protein